MNVLLICNEYPPYKHGGIGTFTRDLAEGLTHNGHNVTVWGCYENLEEDVIEKINDVNVVRVKYKPKFSRINHLIFVLFFNSRLKKYLSGNKNFDIVECQEWQGLLPWGLKHSGYVVRLHGASVFFDFLLGRKGNRLTHFLEKHTINKGKYLVAVSKYCGQETLAILGINKPFETIYNGVSENKLKLNIKVEPVEDRIVFANSMLPKKGVFELASAFNLIKKHHSKATLIFIGKTGYAENGINVKDLVLERVDPAYRKDVHVLGWLKSAFEVYEYLLSAEVCVYPSHMEGLGIAPIEGMMLAKPVVFMNSGPGPEIIEDKISGFLTNTKDFEAIAQTLIEVLNDKEKSKLIGLNGHKRALEKFNLDTSIIRENIKFYEEIISSNKKKA